MSERQISDSGVSGETTRPLDLSPYRRIHRKGAYDFCTGCGRDVPCPTMELVHEVETLRAEVDRLRTENELLRSSDAEWEEANASLAETVDRLRFQLARNMPETSFHPDHVPEIPFGKSLRRKKRTVPDDLVGALEKSLTRRLSVCGRCGGHGHIHTDADRASFANTLVCSECNGTGRAQEILE